MADDASWVPPGVDTQRANVARVYDYLLGGSHNFRADRDVGRVIMAIEPNARAIGRANRAFLGRAVRFVSSAGISQFLDIGSGLPAEGNVHEIAQQVRPGARVVYVDADPVVIAHSQALLEGNANATVVEADLRQPARILTADGTTRLLDLSRPAALLLVAVLHFIPDGDDPWHIVAQLRDALAPGSYLVLCHGTDEGKPAVARAGEKMFGRSVSAQLQMRSRAEILRFFDGFELVEPGLVPIPAWRPDPCAAGPAGEGTYWGGLVGVARKPG